MFQYLLVSHFYMQSQCRFYNKLVNRCNDFKWQHDFYTFCMTREIWFSFHNCNHETQRDHISSGKWHMINIFFCLLGNCCKRNMILSKSYLTFLQHVANHNLLTLPWDTLGIIEYIKVQESWAFSHLIISNDCYIPMQMCK